MRRWRIWGIAIVLLAAPWLGGCLVSARPDVAPADLLPLPLAGAYEVVSTTGLFERGSGGKYRARIATLAPGSYRLAIAPPEDAADLPPVVYEFRILGGKAGEYLAIHELPESEGKEVLTHYVLIRAAGDSWSVNAVEPQGDVATLLQATQAVGLGIKLRGSLIELTGTLTAKALADLFQNARFRDQLVLSESWKIRPLPGQGFSPSDAR
jgi:hypothetical protein